MSRRLAHLYCSTSGEDRQRGCETKTGGAETVNRSPRTYDRLDVAALKNVPPELGEGIRFVCWREAVRDGKPTKIPVNPHTGDDAESDNAATWGTLAEAVAFYKAHTDTLHGVGRMFHPDDGIIGIDFDNCLDGQGNVIASHVAAEWLPKLNSYPEISPSGKGVKLWLKASHKLDGKTGRRDPKRGVEIYRERRFFTITGRRLPQFSATVEPRQSEVDRFVQAVFPAKKTEVSKPAPRVPSTATDTEIINRASNARNGEKFWDLWDGNWQPHYGSQSEADCGLCGLLWFWTGGDREAVARLFAKSGLMRPKWNRPDYQASTLDVACKGDVYHPGRSGDAELTADGIKSPAFLVLPSGFVTISETAEDLFSRIARARTLYSRGGVPMCLIKDQQGVLTLEEMRPAAFRSSVERYGRLVAWRVGEGNEPILKPVTLPEDMARALLESEAARKHLPRIVGLINCPVILGDGEIVGPGYHEPTGLLITGGTLPPAVEVGEAVNALLDTMSEFDFQTPGDKSRALAALLTPALKLGEHLRGNVPADVAEADKSQSGKTYRQKVVAAFYNERVAMVSCKSGGVGSVDESLNTQLVAGRPFIQLDNFRGKFDSPHVEALLTAEKRFPARIPHCREVEIDPSRFFVSLTSNGVETTRDLANRSSMIRIKKRDDFVFRIYPEGDLLDHVRARQPYYLGCVFAIVREWIRQGQKRTTETRHDFREWCQVLDWIVQHILHQVPLMDGHRAAQERVSNPALTFLRKLALAVVCQGRAGEGLIASELFEITEAEGIDVPGLSEHPEEDRAKRQIGTVMARVFKDTGRVEVDGFVVERKVETKSRDTGGDFESKTYTFTDCRNTTPHNAHNAHKTHNAQEIPPLFPESIEPCAPCAGAESVEVDRSPP